MDDFLTKPVDSTRVERVLHQWIDGADETAAARDVAALAALDAVEPLPGTPGRESSTWTGFDMLHEMVKDGVSLFQRSSGNFIAHAPDHLAAIRAAVETADADGLVRDRPQAQGQRAQPRAAPGRAAAAELGGAGPGRCARRGGGGVRDAGPRDGAGDRRARRRPRRTCLSGGLPVGLLSRAGIGRGYADTRDAPPLRPARTATHPVAPRQKVDPMSSTPVDVFELGAEHEQVVFANDPATGLRAIIAIHSTALGPALGGTRFYPYASTADARAATSSTSRAACPTRPRSPGSTSAAARRSSSATRPPLKTEALLRAYGRFVQSLNGRYYTACDVGTYSEDMDDIARECDFVTGRTVAHGGAGDSSVLTAYGVFQGMRAAAEVVWGAPTAGRPDRRRRRRRQGRPPPGAAPGRGRRDRRRHRRPPAVDRPGARDEFPQVRRGRRRPTSWSPPTLDVYAPCALGGGADRRGRRGAVGADRLRRGQQPARPPGHREGARGARASSTRPTTA